MSYSIIKALVSKWLMQWMQTAVRVCIRVTLVTIPQRLSLRDPNVSVANRCAALHVINRDKCSQLRKKRD